MANNSERIILVTGATGQQGGAVYRHLQRKGFKLRALVRDSNSERARALMGHGQEVFQGDLEDGESLARALDGVHGVYSVQPFTDDAPTEIKQGVALIEAANREGVSHFVYSSVVGADEQTGIAHFESKGKIEEHLRSSGLNYTIFRPVFFMENWQTMMGEPIEQGVIPLPLSPTTRLQMVAVDDIGTFVALAFEHSGKWKGRTFSVAGDELSMQEIALALSRILTREVRYVQTPWEEFERQGGQELAVMYRWFESKGYHVDLDAVRRENPQTTTFNRWLEGSWGAASAAVP
jgi:uncharacterized protein YbjT (DUF2867 family)